MREAVVNAIVHRDYACPATIQIRVYDDRISIWNAARLSPDWAAEQLAEEHSSRPHNPRVAQVFFRAGMIEAWGRGIRRIVDLCHDLLSWTHGARHPLLLEGFGNVSAARSQSLEELRFRPRDFHGLRAQLQALQELTKR